MSQTPILQCPAKRKENQKLPPETKPTKICRVTDAGGIMDKLPDDLLLCIFLRIGRWRDIMSAGRVSRRWKRLCDSLSKINFKWDTMFTCRISCPDYEDVFIRQVDRYLNNLKGVHIDSLRLEFCLKRQANANLDRWITIALHKGVRELDLKLICEFDCTRLISPGPFYTLRPRIVKKVTRLEVLSLRSCILPRGIAHQFKGLRSLRLVYVKLGQGVFEGFVSGCRNIESIHLDSVTLPEVVHIPDSLMQLQYFSVINCFGVKQLDISSPNLTTYSYIGAMIMLSFREVSCLKNVCLELRDPNEVLIGRNLLRSFVGVNAKLETLKLLFHSFSLAPQAVDAPIRFTRFDQLKKLEIFGIMPLRLDVQKIVNILDACPFLEKFFLLTVKLEEGERVHNEIFYRRLKEVSICAVVFTDSYLKLATHLLEYSVVLEKMVLDPGFRDYLSGYRQTQVRASVEYAKVGLSGEVNPNFREQVLAHRKASLVEIRNRRPH